MNDQHIITSKAPTPAPGSDTPRARAADALRFAALYRTYVDRATCRYRTVSDEWFHPSREDARRRAAWTFFLYLRVARYHAAEATPLP